MIGPYGKIWRPWVYSAVQEIDSKFPTTSAGTYPGHDPSIRLACDFMIPSWQITAGITLGNALAHSLDDVATCKRLGIWYLIWRGRIWSMTRPEKGWIRYFDADNPNPSRAHKNHVHVSWYDKRPAGWVDPATYKPNLKATVYLDRLKPGVTDSDSVAVVQEALLEVLHAAGIGTGPLEVTGDWGTATTEAAKSFQMLVEDDLIDGRPGPYDVAELLKRANMTNKVEEKA